MKNVRRIIAVMLAVLMVLSVSAALCFAEETTLAPDTTDVQETTTGLMDKIEGMAQEIDLGIDGFAVTEMFGKIMSWFLKLIDNIRYYIENDLNYEGFEDIFKVIA